MYTYICGQVWIKVYSLAQVIIKATLREDAVAAFLHYTIKQSPMDSQLTSSTVDIFHHYNLN